MNIFLLFSISISFCSLSLSVKITFMAGGASLPRHKDPSHWGELIVSYTDQPIEVELSPLPSHNSGGSAASSSGNYQAPILAPKFRSTVEVLPGYGYILDRYAKDLARHSVKNLHPTATRVGLTLR
jgi:hypothetical protein